MKIEKQVQMTLSNLDDEKYHFGTDNDFWLVYDEETDDAFELWTSDGDGSGTNTQLLSIPSGGAEIFSSAKFFIGPAASSTDFPGAHAVVSSINTPASDLTTNIGLVSEELSDDTHKGIGLWGIGYQESSQFAYGIMGSAFASPASTGVVFGGSFSANSTRAAGTNVGIFAYAGGAPNNYALRILNGDISTLNTVDWDLIDNNGSAFSFDSSGKTGILEIDTTNSSEKVNMSGGLSVAGSVVSLSGLPTSDPAVAGQLWVDTSASYVIKVSQG